MKILFDNSAPGPLTRFLRRHEVAFARKLRWQTLDDGTLLDAAERDGFDVLLTCDQNFAYQQNLHGRKLAVVIVATNSWPKMKPLPRVLLRLLTSPRRAKSPTST